MKSVIYFQLTATVISSPSKIAGNSVTHAHFSVCHDEIITF
jgi:hypothetical protein